MKQMSRAMTAVVIDNQDPDSLGRVKVRIPHAGDEPETWGIVPMPIC